MSEPSACRIEKTGQLWNQTSKEWEKGCQKKEKTEQNG